MCLCSICQLNSPALSVGSRYLAATYLLPDMRLTTKIIINNKRLLRQLYAELSEMEVTELDGQELENYHIASDRIRKYRSILESLPSPATYEQEMSALEKIDSFKASFAE